MAGFLRVSSPTFSLVPTFMGTLYMFVGSGGRAVERRIVNRGDGGSIPPTAVSKLRQFRSPHIYLCLSEETLKAGGPFYLVSMPEEVKYPTQGVCVTSSGLTNSREKDNSCVSPNL